MAMTPEQLEKNRIKLHKLHQRRQKEGREILGGKCAVCGTIENLQFDHIDWRTKEIEMSRDFYPKERWYNELKKCQLLCKPHHKEKSAKEFKIRYRTPPDKRHGTYNEYNRHKCRCELCMGAYKDYLEKRKPRRNALYRLRRQTLTSGADSSGASSDFGSDKASDELG